MPEQHWGVTATQVGTNLPLHYRGATKEEVDFKLRCGMYSARFGSEVYYRFDADAEGNKLDEQR